MRRLPNGKPQERLRFRALRSKTLAFKKRIAIIFLRFQDFPRGQGLRLGPLCSKNAAFCICVLKPTKITTVLKAPPQGSKRCCAKSQRSKGTNILRERKCLLTTSAVRNPGASVILGVVATFVHGGGVYVSEDAIEKKEGDEYLTKDPAPLSKAVLGPATLIMYISTSSDVIALLSLYKHRRFSRPEVLLEGVQRILWRVLSLVPLPPRAFCTLPCHSSSVLAL